MKRINMTLEEKDLLWEDLSARVPYGVKINTPRGIYTVDGVSNDGLFSIPNDDNSLDDLTPHDGHYWLPIIEDYKPYLRPISSMTLTELCEFCRLFECDCISAVYGYINCTVGNNGDCNIKFSKLAKIITWLNCHHFDYRGLIEKGLVLEAPKDMYN